MGSRVLLVTNKLDVRKSGYVWVTFKIRLKAEAGYVTSAESHKEYNTHLAVFESKAIAGEPSFMFSILTGLFFT